ncbi:hypothetical protein SK128_009061, partial [Halocaridina rubra]
MGEDTKYCGNCKREVSAVNFTIHTVHCQRNIAVCSICNQPVPRSHYQQHVENNHKSVPCPKCSEEVEPLQLFAHEREHCPRRMLTCEHCELEVVAADHERHKEYCEARTERCKGCTKYVQVRYLQFHYETDHKYIKPEDKVRADENGSDDEGSECPICLGPVTLPLALDCGHVFCMVCVKGIANTTKNCAICRRDITRDMLMDIRFCREEDIIKNYVNRPREKKTTRSHSVPSRGTGPGGRRLVHHTTEDYDEMVSALMSSRTTAPSYRYQRPSNTHTPPQYTPYSTTTTNAESCQDLCKDSCKDSTESCKDSFQDDDCCCSSTQSSSTNSSTTSTTTTNTISLTASSSMSSTTTTTMTTSSERASRDSMSRTSSVSSYVAPPVRSSSASRALTSSSYSSRSSSVTASRTTTSSTENSSTSNTDSFSSSSSSISCTLSTTSYSSTTSHTSSVSTSSSVVASSSSSTSSTTKSSSSSTASTTSSYSPTYGARPRRPTTLALETNAVLASLTAETSSSRSRLSGSRSAEPPENATQEQYDRWLAFQLAKADDDLPPSEFNRKHKPTFRRSFSMPERPDKLSDSSSSSESDSDTPSSRGSSRRPPASPRSTATYSSSASSSSRSTPISKSSSDSNASSSSGSSSGSSALSTGARPKSSGLRKRVSFKEDAPPIRREAPVLLPCEFCDEMFPERDLMRHQTSCEQNETQLPRTSRLAQLAAANSSAASSSTTNSTATVNSSTRVASVSSPSVTSPTSDKPITTGPSSPPPRRRQGRMPTPVCAPPRKGTAPFPIAAVERKPTDTPTAPSRKSPAPTLPPRRAAACNPETATISPPPSCPSSISPPPLSPPPTTTITIVDQPPAVVVSPSLSSGSNRPFSVSPASSTSTNSSSASSGSLSSSSTTPSTSSSASPVPVSMHTPELAPPDTPTTDLECELDEDIPFSRPRKGRLLSSAIFSWRSISGSAATRRGGYARSNTAPLEDTGTGDSPQPIQPVTTSHSATQLPVQRTSEKDTPPPYPKIPRSPSPTKRPPKQISPPPQSDIIKEPTKEISPPPQIPLNQEHADSVFIKNPNKYKAPPPPPQIPTHRASPSPDKPPIIASTISDNYNKKTSPPPQPHLPVIYPTEVKQRSPSPQEKQTTDSTKSHTNHERNGFIKFDSKPMMNGFPQREVELRINCEFCKQVFTPEKFRSHQTVCEAALRPVSRRPASAMEQSTSQKSKSPLPARHNKGPAPPPPESTPPDFPSEEPAPSHKRLERSHSVKDDRSSYRDSVRVTRRLERASSIKESRTTSSSSYADKSYRWGSRETLYSNGMDSPSTYASTGWSGSTSNLYTGWGSSGSHAWSSHINMVRDDLRTRTAAASVTALHQDNGGDSDNGVENDVDTEGNGRDRSRSRYSSSNSLLNEVRAALNKTSFSHFAVDTGGARYRERSTSRTRPASMFSMSSGGWGSMFDLSSPSRQFNISDAFSSASLASK